MKNLKTYKQFLNENNINESNENEYEYFMSKLLELPTDEILEIRDEIYEMAEESEFVTEGFSDFMDKLKRRFGSWIDDKIIKFLINRKKEFYVEIADKLNLFDLTTLDDVVENYPKFKGIKSMYLAGGMDDAEDTGAGWRNTLEYEFEIEHPGKKKPGVQPIMIGKTEVVPSYVVDGEFLDMFLQNPNKTITKYFDTPCLLNPVRKEVDRNKDDQFDKAVAGLKSPDFDPTKNEQPYKFFRNTFSKNIEPDDEHLLRIADVVFLGYDSSAGAGTFGELELLSLSQKPLFAWLVNNYNNRPGTFKLWNIPHLSKVARTKEDMQTLVKTIIRYS